MSLVRDYKNEVEDIFAADKQLGNEIMYDIGKFEEENNPKTAAPGLQHMMSPAAAALTPRAQASPTRSPSVFASASKLGSPNKFTAPRIRGQATERQTGSKPMNSRLSALRHTNQRSSPLAGRSPLASAMGGGSHDPLLGTPNAGSAAAGSAGSVATAQKQSLNWVRTPSGKRAGASPVIKLMSPGSEAVQKKMWGIKPSAKAGGSVEAAEKRARASATDDAENTDADTNARASRARRSAKAST